MMYSCSCHQLTFLFSVTPFHHPHAFPSYSGPSFLQDTPPPIPKPTLPPLPCFSHFPAQPQTEEREMTLHHHHHHLCWIVIRFRVDSWCGSSIILPNLSPYLCKMKSTFWNVTFIARGHNKAHHRWHSIASHSFTTRVSCKFPFIFPKETLLNTE